MGFELPADALEERFLAATGPGGQNVNKVATAVQLRIDATRLGLTPDAYRRLRVLAGRRMTADGAIMIVARRFRTREANRVDARARAAELIARAQLRETRRVATKPSRAAKARRVESKAKRGAVKQGRGRVDLD